MSSSNVPPLVVVLLICLIYMVLGCVLESMSMILLTVPIFYPIVVEGLGYDPVWFGVIVVVITEISLITPPIGLNVFVLKGALPEIPSREIFKNLLPFIIADFIRLALLVIFPIIALALPSHFLR